jgi:hypothetical protein
LDGGRPLPVEEHWRQAQKVVLLESRRAPRLAAMPQQESKPVAAAEAELAEC